MAVLTAGELYDVAIGIERNGAAYYSSLTERVADPDLKKTYSDLAEMEKHHIRLFEDMKSAVSSGPVITPDVEEEYDAYVQALID